MGNYLDSPSYERNQRGPPEIRLTDEDIAVRDRRRHVKVAPAPTSLPSPRELSPHARTQLHNPARRSRTNRTEPYLNRVRTKTRDSLTPLPQVGGELLWIRTDTAGKVKRRVLSTAASFLTSPRLRRRVVLSLNGIYIDGNHAPASADSRAADASASMRGQRRRQRQVSG